MRSRLPNSQARTAILAFFTLCAHLLVPAQDPRNLRIHCYDRRNSLDRTNSYLVDRGLSHDSAFKDALFSNRTSVGARLMALRGGDDHVLPKLAFTLDFLTCDSGFTKYKNTDVSHGFDTIQPVTSIEFPFKVKHAVAGTGAHV